MKTPIPWSPEELEELVRRVVREELSYLLRKPTTAILDDEEHEGPDDPVQDEYLLREALERVRQYRVEPETVMNLDELRRELARAEAAGELPD